MSDKTCALCDKPPRRQTPEPGRRHATFDWVEWQLSRRCIVSVHETCVVELIKETLRKKQTGQGELFGLGIDTERKQ